MTISNSTLYTDTWLAVRAILVSASITVEGDSISIVASYPDAKKSKPVLVIQPILKNESLDKFGSSEGKKAVTVVLECYDTSTKRVEYFSQQVEAAMKAGSLDNLELMSIDSDWAFQTPGNNKQVLKTISLGYDRE